jgi:hypothetical protein
VATLALLAGGVPFSERIESPGLRPHSPGLRRWTWYAATAPPSAGAHLAIANRLHVEIKWTQSGVSYDLAVAGLHKMLFDLRLVVAPLDDLGEDGYSPK